MSLAAIFVVSKVKWLSIHLSLWRRYCSEVVEKSSKVVLVNISDVVEMEGEDTNGE